MIMGVLGRLTCLEEMCLRQKQIKILKIKLILLCIVHTKSIRHVC